MQLILFVIQSEAMNLAFCGASELAMNAMEVVATISACLNNFP
jgi:hypothetical protein